MPDFKGLPAPASGGVDLLVIAGEHSGDQHGATMVRELLAKRPGLRVAALGGHELERAGAQLLHDMTAFSVVGFVEPLVHIRFLYSLFNAIVGWVAKHRPKAVCFVDYPGMNLRLAAALRKKGLSVKGGGPVKMLFYISPQIWAWKAKRRFSMAESLDALSVIFPFETECYADTNLPVSFVGHPFVMEGYEAPVSYDPAGPVLLLPGSRRQAVRRIVKPLFQAYARGGAGREAVVLYPSEVIRKVLEAAKPPPGVRLQPTGTPVAASAVLTSSGTMSMHCALAGIPGAIVYRAHPLTYFFGKMLVKTQYIGIANLLLKEPMYPEFIQDAARPEVLEAQLQECLNDPARREQTARLAAKLRDILHQPATGTVADWVLQQL
jgi:lipid-A-disaccharide synthase